MIFVPTTWLSNRCGKSVDPVPIQGEVAIKVHSKHETVKNTPFFIIGCVRSGTTLLRDVLRNHPRLAAPEETHFFRWAEPFGGVPYRNTVCNNRVLKRHRELDRIDEEMFQELLDQSVSRADLYRRYMQCYIETNKPEAQRWFDKSPQNVYGAALIASDMPGAQFIHIVRHPLDVVSSLRIGKVMKVANIIGACNYWKEAADIVHVIKKAFPDRVYEVRYEDFTRQPEVGIKALLDFLGEDYDASHYKHMKMAPKRHKHAEIFSAEEICQIQQLCRRWSRHYGYFAEAS